MNKTCGCADAAAPPPQAQPGCRRERRRVEAFRRPEDALILIPTRNLVLFPGTVLPITLGRQRTIVGGAGRDPASTGRSGCCCSATPQPMTRCRVDLHRIGTEATLLRYVTSPDGTHHAICQGERRFRVLDFVDGYPFFAARVERVPEVEATSTEIDGPAAQSAQSGARGPAAAAAGPGRARQRRADRSPRPRRSPI